MAMAKLALLLLVAALLAGTTNGDCNYRVEFRTDNLPLTLTGAGAGAYLELYNQDGGRLTKGDRFDQRIDDTITFAHQECWKPCRVIFTIFATNFLDQRICQYVQVRVNNEISRFEVHQPVIYGRLVEVNNC